MMTLPEDEMRHAMAEVEAAAGASAQIVWANATPGDIPQQRRFSVMLGNGRKRLDFEAEWHLLPSMAGAENLAHVPIDLSFDTRCSSLAIMPAAVAFGLQRAPEPEPLDDRQEDMLKKVYASACIPVMQLSLHRRAVSLHRNLVLEWRLSRLHHIALQAEIRDADLHPGAIMAAVEQFSSRLRDLTVHLDDTSMRTQPRFLWSREVGDLFANLDWVNGGSATTRAWPVAARAAETRNSREVRIGGGRVAAPERIPIEAPGPAPRTEFKPHTIRRKITL